MKKRIFKELPNKNDWNEEGLFHLDGCWYGIALFPCEHPGVLEVKFPIVRRDSDSQQSTTSTACDKTSAPTKDTGGRPETALPMASVQRMAQKGLTVRDIAKQLTFDGFSVSYRTVYRRLREKAKQKVSLL